MSPNISNISLNEAEYAELMNVKVSDKATIADVAQVVAKKNFIGRFFVQLKLLIKGKGWVSPDLLKGLNARELMQIQEGCHSSVLQPKNEVEKPAALDPRVFEEISLDDDHIVPLSEQDDVELEGSNRDSSNLAVKKKMKLVNALERAVSHVFEERDSKEMRRFKFLAKLPLNSITSNSKLNQFYSSYLAENPLDEQSSSEKELKKGFILYLTHQTSHEKYTALEKIDLDIGINQLQGKDGKVDELQDKLKAALENVLIRYMDEANASSLFEDYPEMSDRYTRFHQTKESHEKRSDYPESKSNVENSQRYPFYKEFIETVINTRVSGVLPLEFKNFFNEQVNRPVANLLANEKHLDTLSGVNIKIEEGESDAKIFEHMAKTIIDPHFAKEASEFLHRLVEADEEKFNDFDGEIVNRFNELEKKYWISDANGHEFYHLPMDVPHLFAAVLIASGFSPKDSQKVFERITSLNENSPDNNYTQDWLEGIELVDDLASKR